MAGYRQFHTKFWKDDWLIDIDPLKKFLFIYLFTNELSSISGIYKIPLRVIINETGLDKNFIVSALAEFQENKKIAYADGVMWVVNMRKLHKNASPTTMTKVDNDIESIPDCSVKRAYLHYQETGIYSIDTVSILNSESLNKSKSIKPIEIKKSNAQKPRETDFPPSLDNDVFKIKWQEWLDYRKQAKMKTPQSTADRQLKMLSKFPVDIAMQMIDQSIDFGYQGLFPVKNKSTTTSRVLQNHEINKSVFALTPEEQAELARSHGNFS